MISQAAYRSIIASVLFFIFGCCLRATPIHDAVREGDVAKVGALLAINPTLVDAWDDESTPLTIAAADGRLEMVKLLLEKGATIDAKSKQYGYTPLMLASVTGHLDMVKLLLEKGAAIEARSKFGLTPLWCATAGSKLEVIKYLLEKGAVIEAKANNNYTPLMNAAERGHIKVVSLLLENGKNLDVDTALRIAQKTGNAEIIKLLQKAGAK